MGLKDLMGKAQELTSVAADTAADAAGRFLDEFNEALPTMRALGFTIKDFRMSMAVVPEIHAKLVASVDTISVSRIDELISQHADRKLLVAILKALKAAYHIREQLGETSFRSVEMEITLGVPPHISVGFGSNAPSAVSAASSA